MAVIMCVYPTGNWKQTATPISTYFISGSNVNAPGAIPAPVRCEMEMNSTNLIP